MDSNSSGNLKFNCSRITKSTKFHLKNWIYYVKMEKKETCFLGEILKLFGSLDHDKAHLKRIKKVKDEIMVWIPEKMVQDERMEWIVRLMVKGKEVVLRKKIWKQVVPNRMAFSKEEYDRWMLEYWPVKITKPKEYDVSLAKEWISKLDLRSPNHCFIVDPTSKEIVFEVKGNKDLIHSTHDPLNHLVLLGLQGVSRKQLASRKRKRNGSQYLCTNYIMFITHEPCLMCAMALVHSRINQVHFILKMDEDQGGFSGAYLHENKNVNHRYAVFQWE